MNAKITKREDFTKAINELGLKTGVEIGVHKGHFSEHILANSNIEKMYSVDAWLEDEEITKAVRKKCDEGKMELCYQETVKKLSRFGDRSVIIRGLSEDVVKQFENESLDFVYIDASHMFTGFTLDLINWWEKTKWGGLFSGHDYWRRYRYEVMYAVNGFCMENKQLFNITTEERQFPQFGSSWWLIKTKRHRKDFLREFQKHKEILKKQSEEILKIKHIITDIPYECYD
jgi:hypothetical protein